MPLRVLARRVQVALSIDRVRQDIIVMHILQLASLLLLLVAIARVLLLSILDLLLGHLCIGKGLETLRLQSGHLVALHTDDFLFDPSVFGSRAQHIEVGVKALVDHHLCRVCNTRDFVFVIIDVRLDESSEKCPQEE